MQNYGHKKRILLNKQAASAPQGILPILHLHGHVSDTESVIITEEDYITLFRPAVYRQLKLATLLKESVPMLIGYSLSDVNVLVTMDWASNALSDISRPTNKIGPVQIIYTDQTPKDDPYKLSNGLLVLETKSNLSTLDEIANECSSIKSNQKTKQEQAKDILEKLASIVNSGNLTQWHDEAFRGRIITYFSKFHDLVEENILTYLGKVFVLIRMEASKRNNFDAYADWLAFLVDILAIYGNAEMPESLFRFILDELDDVGQSIGQGIGYSWKATQDWQSLKSKIPSLTFEKLERCSCSDFRFGLIKLGFTCPK